MGLLSKWNYTLRVTNWEEHQPADVLKPLEDAINSHFIPALTGQPPLGEQTRNLLALPIRLGGLGLTNPVLSAEEQYDFSQKITEPLVKRITSQEHQLGDCHSIQQHIKRDLKDARNLKQTNEVNDLLNNVSTSLKRSMELSQEKA